MGYQVPSEDCGCVLLKYVFLQHQLKLTMFNILPEDEVSGIFTNLRHKQLN